MMTHTGASSPGSKMISPIYTNPFHFVVQKPLFKVLLRYITVASSDLSRRCFPHDFSHGFSHGFFNGTMGRWSNLPRSSQGTLTLKSLDRLLSLAAPWRQRMSAEPKMDGLYHLGKANEHIYIHTVSNENV